MDNSILTPLISDELSLPESGISNTLQLLADGCTIPFISRYRKERTGGLDEVQIAAISEMNDRLNETAIRKYTIIKTITEQGKMTGETDAGTLQSWKTYIFHISRNGGQGHKWHVSKDWNRCRL